jgi:hypothetical protein
MAITIGTYCFFRSLSVILNGFKPSQDNRETDRQAEVLTKCTKDKLCIKLVFL